MLCLLLGLVCNVVWADFTQSWTASPVAPWGTTDLTSGQYPDGIATVLETAKGNVRLAETEVTATANGTATVTFVYSGGSHKLNILGVDLVNESGVVVSYDYHHGTTGTSHSKNTYTLSGVVAGDYTLRYFVNNAGKDGDQVNQTNGNITITGLSLPAPKKTYTITIQGDQTIKIGNKEYKNGDTYTVAGVVSKSDILVTAPEGQFAAVSIDDANCTINVYFAVLPTQSVSGTYTNAVLYPKQQNTVGEAVATKDGDMYTLSNNVLAASYAKMGNAIYFAGSKAMDLVAGTEPFTVAFGAGEVVPASAMTLESIAFQKLEGNANAIGGADHYDGQALVANYKYTYKESDIEIVWRAVLRDGSHYLRTEMELKGVDDVDMFNIIPMIYNVDTKAAGSTPAVVGNTRGAILMSNKILAGLETPTAYNTVGDAIGEEDNWNLVATPVTDNLSASAWTVQNDVPKRIEEVGGSDKTYYAYDKEVGQLKKDQKVVATLTYKSGAKRFDIDGVVLLDENGSIVASDFHHGYAGNPSDKNSYTFTVPNAGDFKVRVYIDGREGDIVSTSEFKVEVYEPKAGVVINTDIVAIQGRWSRNTTLAKGETWKVGAVVGLVAQDGTQDNADIHSTQKRRSFLAYSERERAVPWRANPCYISWYELNINRNNAAPGSEPNNMNAEQVLDVLAHWKSDFYDRYGMAPNMFVIDDGWDTYGEWNFHTGFPNEMVDIAKAAKEMDGAGVGAWLGPVGGYGQSGDYRRSYWSDKGGMQLSNPRYYEAFKKAAYNLVKNQGDNYTFFKFDGISNDFSATGPDRDLAVDVANEDAEGIIRLERYVREELREDIFFNTTVGTWASPFWYQITDATWRQENDHDRIGNNNHNREKWITYRDNLVHQNYVANSPICPINTLMTHGFILTKFGPPAGDPRDYKNVLNELRCAFLCGSGMVELYNDYDLMNSINGGALWADLAECIAWQKRNADVLMDAHWVGGDPWTGSKSEVYGWAAWNGTKSSLALRNGANDSQQFKFTLRQALNIPANVSGSIILRSAFGVQDALEGLTEGTAINIDTELTVTLPGSSVYAFEGIDASATVNNVSSITITSEGNAKEVEMGSSLVLQAAVNAGATFPAIAWTSSDESVATISGGLVLPKKEGSVTIKATAKDGSNTSASVTITVKPKTIDMDAPVVTDLKQLSNDKVYTLTSARAFLFYRPESSKVCSSTGTAVGSVTLDKTNPNHQFRIEKKGDNYYLYSVGAEKYVAKDGSFVATATAALTLSDVSADRPNYPWKLILDGNGLNSQDGGQTAEGIVFNNYTTTDAGNCYKIEVGVPKSYEYTIKVLGAEGAKVTYNGEEYQNDGTFETSAVLKKSDFTASAVDGMFSVITIDGNNIYASYFANGTKFYTIKGGHGGYVSLGDGYHDNGNLLLSKTDAVKDNKGIWAFVGNSTDGYKIYNYSTGLSKVLGITGTEADARTTMVALDNAEYKTLFSGVLNLGSTDASVICISGTGHYWNKRGNYLALWETGQSTALGDTGCKFFITEVDPADYSDTYIHEVSEISGVASFQPKNPNTLWYKTSAEASGVNNPWMEYALPLGNGELGCMVFGGVAHEELQFNEKTLWSGPANQVGAGGGNRTFMNFGSLIIANNDASIHTEGVTDYVRYLDIEEGIAGVEFKNANGTKQVRKYFSSAPDQVIAGQYKSEGEDKMNLVFSLEPGSGINASKVTYEDGMAYFTGAMTVKYAARLHVVADDDAVVTATNSGIKVNNATEVTFYLKGATNFDGDVNSTSYFTSDDADDVNVSVKTAIETAAVKGFEELESAHVEDFTAITKRMTLNLGLTTPTVDTKTLVDNYYPNNQNGTSTQNDHLFLEQLYFHYGRYLAISSNRKDIAAPNNLQGIWNDRGTDSPWNSDIHTNINIQMNYWPTEITNLSDLHKPFVNFILRGANSEGWKQVANNYNDGYGWSVLTETSLYNSMSTWGSNYLVANVWYTSHLWTHWRYTQDKEFLKKAFPVMWDCAEFWFHRLIEDRKVKDGTYVAPDEFSAEQHGNEKEDGTAHAQQMISYLFQNLSDAIGILGVENTGLTTEQVAKLNEYLEKTDKGLHTETYDGAWGDPFNGVKSGELMLREWKYSPYSVGERGHRHMSHMMALFPMDQITPESEYFTPAVNALKLRGDAATGWSMGWKVNLWARAQDGDHAHIIIKNALKHSTTYGTDQGQGGIYYNLFDSHAPFQIDGNFGVCSGIAEMLMQSAHGYINILPALPKVWEATGEVTGMKAIGNFTVGFNWQNGKAQKVTIVSNAGAELKVRCKRGAMDIANALITVDGDEVAATVENGIATIPCEKGQTVVINFTQESTPAEFTQRWTASPVAPWSTDALTAGEYPEAVAVNGFAVHKAETAVTATRNGEVTINFVYSGGSHKLNILGVDLVNDEGTVVASDYHHGTTGGNHSNNTYTLNSVAAGNYTLRYFAGQGNGDALNQTNGTITVTGLQITGEAPSKLPKAGKYYRIGYDFGGNVGVLYMQSTASPVKGLAMTNEQGEGSIFLVEDVNGNLRLKSISTGKYLKEDGNTRGLQTEGGNVTFTEGTDGKFKIQATSYLHANNSDNNYFVDHCGNDAGHDQHNFIVEEVKVRTLTVEGPANAGATATWNGATKALPATWTVFNGLGITDSQLTINSNSHTLTGLYENGIKVSTPVEIATLTSNRTFTAEFAPAFFSTTYGEKWVRLSNCSNNAYWATVENIAAQGNGKTATLDYADEKQLWCLVGTPESFVLYNKAAGEDKALNVPLAADATSYSEGNAAQLTTDKGTWKLIEQDFGYALAPTAKDANNTQGINMWAGAGGYLKLYATGASNKGSYWMVEMADVNKPLTLNVEVDKVWESSPRVAELTFTINGKASQTRILGSIEGQTLYLPAGATYEVSSMTYRGYTYNGCTNNDGVLTASYTANDERTLFYTPRDGHPYRIPAIATAPNGDIFAICDYRPCGNDIGYGEVDLVCRVSSDNGVTWTDERTIADGLGHINDGIWKMGFGDPAIVADRESNKVLVMSVCGNRTCWDGNYGEGGDNENPNRISRLYITYDEAKKEWVYGEPEEVTYDIYPLFDNKNGGEAHVASMFIGAGKICQSRVVKKGDYYRLYCSVWAVTKSIRTHHNYVIYSDDFGQSWHVLGGVGNDANPNQPGPAFGGNEPKCEELPDGTVVLSSRKGGGRYFNLFTFNDDTYTTGSWGTCASSNDIAGGLSFGGNSTNGEIYKVKAIRKSDGKICDIMLQSVPTGSGRSDVAIFYKEMEYNEDGTNIYTPQTFATGWTKGIHVSTKESCYSTMILQADGRIGFFFEEAPGGYCMVYIPYTIEDVTGGAYSLYTVNSTISEHGIGTFYASEAMQIPEGVKAYVATEKPSMNGTDAEGNATGVIIMTELEGIIPAKTGAVLRGEADDYKFIPSISYGTPVDGNMLVGYEGVLEYEEVSLPTDGSTNYVLAVEDGKAGFYRKETGFKVYNHKAYLNLPASFAAGARAIYFDFGGETGVDEVKTENGNVKTDMYDLAGRRVVKAQKGVYIVNGELKVVK